jgi:glutathione S-transferase
MLKAKRVPYERLDLIPALHRASLRLSGFAGVTVPALRLHGARVQGTREIARALDASWPEPPFFPTDPAARARIARIEAWGEGPLQVVARRIILWSLLHSHQGAVAALDGAHLQFRTPLPVAAAIAAPILRLDAAMQGAHAAAVRADLTLLPDLLDKADSWIASGDLGTSPPTAADYQVAGSIRMLVTVSDLAGLFADRPIAELARGLIPDFPGRVPVGVLPVAWRP